MEEAQKLINDHSAMVLYFTHEECNVCKVLKPKIRALLQESFPKIHFHEIDTVKNPGIAAWFSVFAVPTLLVFFDKSEFFRFSRHVNIKEFTESLTRPYQLFFE
ncbi:MAG: thioredoxin family protein [Candidatus Marinimicrobia bacterium]|nr:thioredoxin family protein [Candidatus Neomarinimicrobiota bacterium]